MSYIYLNQNPGASASVQTGYRRLNLNNIFGLTVSLKSDVTGTLTIEWSADGSTLATSDTLAITDFNHNKNFAIKREYVNIKFTNGTAVASSIFFLKAFLNNSEDVLKELVPQDVNIVSGSVGGGDATASNQLSINSNVVAVKDSTDLVKSAVDTVDASVISMNSNVVLVKNAVDTVNTTLSGTLTVSDSTAQTSLSSIDTKLTSQATLAEQQTQSGYLNTINTSLSGTLDVSDATAQATLTSINTSLSGTLAVSDSTAHTKLDTVHTDLITLATEATLADMKSNVSVLAGTVNVNGEQKVSVSAENIGSYNNVANNITLNAGAVTTAVSIAEIAEGSLFYEDSSTSSTDPIEILVSADGTNYHSHSVLYPYQQAGSSVRTASFLGGSAHGLKWLQIKNISSSTNYANVKASVYGSH